MKSARARAIHAVVPLLACLAAHASGQQKLDRSVLPIPEPDYPYATELDVRNAKPRLASR
jgi:hypothetical protein